MNARKKAKYYKRMLLDLYEDYVKSAKLASDVFEAAQKRIWDIKSKEVTCVEKIEFLKPRDIDDDLATDMIEMFRFNDDIRRAVVFEGHTDPETGKYILEAKLTVVMPKLETEE